MDNMEKEYTIYAHINMINGKKYIGQTCQLPEHRWNHGNGYKNSPHFYSAINKYGWDNFDHEIIASHLTQDEANNFEKLLIDKLNTTDPNFGYNSDSGGKNNTIFSELTIKKMSESHIGKFSDKQRKAAIKRGEKQRGVKRPCVSGIKSGRAKKIVQLDLAGNYIREWDYIKQASVELNLDSSAITKCCKGKLNQTGGFIFKYLEV